MFNAENKKIIPKEIKTIYSLHPEVTPRKCCYVIGSDVKASVYNAGDLGSIPGSGRFPGEGNGNPHQYFCLENPMEPGTGYCPWGHKELDTTERLH